MIAIVKKRLQVTEPLPEGCKAIPLTQGKYTIVDESDYGWLIKWNWRYHWTGYAVRTESIGDPSIPFRPRKMILMHRRIMNANDDQEVDHVDSNRSNNRRSNLRFCTRSQNCMNASKFKGKTSSKYKGISWAESKGKWCARIKFQGKTIYLGDWDDEIAAAISYNTAAKELFGEFAKINDIEDESSKP